MHHIYLNYYYLPFKFYGVSKGLSIIIIYPIFLSFGCDARLYASEVASSPIIKAKLTLFFVMEIYLDNKL